ncbi:hypothetical protein F4677DRAFT_116857 [Hypoxylon crocopeplum]|nr:hypothetical protein F4677DRAFT_116857 [Hypoxylon crocopeplum]
MLIHQILVLSRVLFSLWAVLSWLVYPTIEATCYNSQGFPWAFTSQEPVEAWKACDPGAEVTNCCGPHDYCMSNGLCLDAVIDNMVSQQGCTDRNWAEPCQNYCGGTQSDAAGLHFLWRCDGQSHCCGSNRSTTCCEDPDIEIFVLKVGTNIFHPPTTTSTALIASQSAGITSSSLPPQPTSGASPITESSSTNDGRNMVIGLGVGIPLGLALIAALGFLAVQFRRWSKQAEARSEAPSQWYAPPAGYKAPEQMGISVPYETHQGPRHGPVELESTHSRIEL